MLTHHIPTQANPNPTVKPQQTAPESANIIPQDATDTVNNIFCFAALIDKQKGTLYTDATGALPEISLDGHQYFCVTYNYDTTYIFAEPITNVTTVLIVNAFYNVFTELTEK